MGAAPEALPERPADAPGPGAFLAFPPESSILGKACNAFCTSRFPGRPLFFIDFAVQIPDYM